MNTESRVSERAAKVTNRTELRRLLRYVLTLSRKSIRTIAEENQSVKDRQGLSRSNISRQLTRDGPISPEFVERFAAACGLKESDQQAVMAAWQRTIEEPEPPPIEDIPAQRPPAEQPSPGQTDSTHFTTLEVMDEVANSLSGNKAALKAARRLYERIRVVRSEALGATDPLTLEAAHNLGTVLAQLDRYHEADEILSTTYEARRHVLGPNADSTLKTLENLATVKFETEDPEIAIELFDKVLAARRPATSPGHAGYCDAAEKFMELLATAGEDARREKIAREIEQICAAPRPSAGP
ncbi:tetratricopeptide repeat protein [Micromonospora chalcea]|uniref:tetratricopeptide repeat protein n=1 Tax=Micromonospora chalcea TaxID=1874 RepID=UPI0023789B6F|nr:tetratricopeptide repeat protein [Micromonospora chalcea]WDQ00881.1 tetratricopeptide repeat protein [Micromonospora chalcea]